MKVAGIVLNYNSSADCCKCVADLKQQATTSACAMPPIREMMKMWGKFGKLKYCLYFCNQYHNKHILIYTNYFIRKLLGKI